MSPSPQSARRHRTGLSRIAAACERCRKRKQKCDAKRPSCGPCAAIGVECVMSDRLVVYTNPNPNCNCDELRNQVAELQKHIESLNAELTKEKELNIQQQSTAASTSAAIQAYPSSNLRGHSQNYTRDASTTNTAMTYRILRPTFGDEDARRGLDVDRLGLAWRLWHNDQSMQTPFQNTSSINDLPINHYGQELVDIFFDNCWAHLPVLHRPTFLHDHYEPVSQGLAVSPLSTFQTYMVFSIAAGAKPATKSGYTFNHRDFFQRAIQDLSHIMTLSDLDYLQCLLLMCMYGRSEPQCVNMWHITGLALRTAVSLNYHHNEGISTDNLYEAEMTKRLFWSAYVMDRSMAIAMGRPLGIQDSDITTSLPLRHTDEQLIAQMPFIQSSTPEVNDTSTFIHVIKLRRLNADIYQTFHSAGNVTLNDTQLDTLRDQFSQQTNQWLMTAPRYMLTTSMQQSPEWFQLAYHHAVLSLNRPSHAAPVPTVASLHLCADASISLISCYGSLYAKNKVSYSFIALNSIFMAAITMLYTLRASSSVRQDLSKLVTQTNINTCLSLFRGISGGREIAERCSQIVSRLGETTLALFDREELPNDHLDLEFMSWFGLKARHNSGNTKGNTVGQAPYNDGDAGLENGNEQLNTWTDEHHISVDPIGPPTNMSIESAWQEFFAPGFDLEGSTSLEFFPMGML